MLISSSSPAFNSPVRFTSGTQPNSSASGMDEKSAEVLKPGKKIPVDQMFKWRKINGNDVLKPFDQIVVSRRKGEFFEVGRVVSCPPDPMHFTKEVLYDRGFSKFESYLITPRRNVYVLSTSQPSNSPSLSHSTTSTLSLAPGTHPPKPQMLSGDMFSKIAEATGGDDLKQERDSEGNMVSVWTSDSDVSDCLAKINSIYSGLRVVYEVSVPTIPLNSKFTHKITISRDEEFRFAEKHQYFCLKPFSTEISLDKGDSKANDDDQSEVFRDEDEKGEAPSIKYVTRRNHRERGSIPNQPDKHPPSDILRRVSRVTGRLLNFKDGEFVSTDYYESPQNIDVGLLRDLHKKPAVSKLSEQDKQKNREPAEIPLPEKYKIRPLQAMTRVISDTLTPNKFKHQIRIKFSDLLFAAATPLPQGPLSVDESQVIELSGDKLDKAKKWEEQFGEVRSDSKYLDWLKCTEHSRASNFQFLPHITQEYEIKNFCIKGHKADKGDAKENYVLVASISRYEKTSLTHFAANRLAKAVVEIPVPKVYFIVTETEIEAHLEKCQDTIKAAKLAKQEIILERRKDAEIRFCQPDSSGEENRPHSFDKSPSEDHHKKLLEKYGSWIEARKMNQTEAEQLLIKPWQFLFRFDVEKGKWMYSLHKMDGPIVHLIYTDRREFVVYNFEEVTSAPAKKPASDQKGDSKKN